MPTGPIRYWVYGVKVRGLPWYRVTDAFMTQHPVGFCHVLRYADFTEIAVLSLRKPKIGTFFNPTRELWSVLEPGYLAFKAEQNFKLCYEAFIKNMRSPEEAFAIGRRLGKSSAFGLFRGG